MPPQGKRSKINPFVLPPGGYRKIKYMFELDEEDINVDINYYHKNHPDVQLQMSDLSVFQPRWSNGSDMENPSYFASNDSHVSQISHETALTTAQSIFHRLYPDSKTHTFNRFVRADDVKNQAPHEPYVLANWIDTETFFEPKLAVFVVAPWILAPKDMSDFVRLHKFTDRRSKPSDRLEQMKFLKCEVLWAMINDFCYANEFRYFVLTSYEEWVFGGFTEHFSHGYVTHPYAHNASDPTVLQVLTFWMHSAMHGEEGQGWVPPAGLHYNNYRAIGQNDEDGERTSLKRSTTAVHVESSSEESDSAPEDDIEPAGPSFTIPRTVSRQPARKRLRRLSAQVAATRPNHSLRAFDMNSYNTYTSNKCLHDDMHAPRHVRQSFPVGGGQHYIDSMAELLQSRRQNYDCRVMLSRQPSPDFGTSMHEPPYPVPEEKLPRHARASAGRPSGRNARICHLRVSDIELQHMGHALTPTYAHFDQGSSSDIGGKQNSLWDSFPPPIFPLAEDIVANAREQAKAFADLTPAQIASMPLIAHEEPCTSTSSQYKWSDFIDPSPPTPHEPQPSNHDSPPPRYTTSDFAGLFSPTSEMEVEESLSLDFELLKTPTPSDTGVFDEPPVVK